MDKLQGVLVPVITPFTNQQVDVEKIRFNILRLNNTPIQGYMVLGSNGEFTNMNDEEQFNVVKVVQETASRDKTVIAGISRQSTYNTIEFGKRVRELGVDYFSILTPSYYAKSMTESALIRYYSEVADQLNINIIIYNCPKFASGVVISPDVLRVLSEHPNIIGMKDTSKGNIESYIRIVDKEFSILAGSIEHFYRGLKAGACGGVLSMANYLPIPCCEIISLFQQGSQMEAEALSDKLIQLNKSVAGQYGVAGVKAAAMLFGYLSGEVRSPLFNCTDQEILKIKGAFQGMGYLSRKE